jgi:predicted RND superfamily exporter protein
MTRFEAAFGEWVVRHRWWLLAVSVFVASVVVSGMRFLTFDNDTRAFFSDDNPQLTALQELEDTYSKTRTVLTSSASSGGLARKRA